ncbi:protein kinase domain-containing protein [Planctomycetaceae bacterium SH139]
MTPEEYQRAQQVFLELRPLDENERQSRIAAIESENASLSRFVRELLDADSKDDSFLTGPLGKLAGNDGETQTHVTTTETASELPTHIGPYRILQRIGEGGHGVVFMAEQTQPIRRKVAIKWIKPGMESKTILARFEAERQALAMMKHPSIANVIDAGVTESNRPYFVMELVHGIPIDQFCDENRTSLKERLVLFQQVCSAVQHAHRKGIIHRDIKPANVLVTVDSGGPLAKVIDFGIAKAMHLSLTDKTLFTEYGQIVGTLEYMSPEQATMSQNSADVRSDVYSLGVLLYRLLTGQTPISKDELLKDGLWELKNVLDTLRPPTPSLRVTSDGKAKSWRDQVDKAGDWLGRLQGDLDWITMKALAKEPEQRYDSVAAFSKDIDNFLEGIPVNARPPTAWYVASRWMRRNRAASVIACAIASCVLVSFVAMTWGYFKSQQNLDDAQNAKQQVAEKAEQLEASLVDVKSQRARADENAGRMAKMLERSILESAWEKALDGDAQQAQISLQDIAPEYRGFVWKFVDSVRQQMDWPSLRSEAAGPIRQSTLHPELGLLAIITTDSKLEIWNITSRKLLQSFALERNLYTTMAFSTVGDSLLVGRSNDSIQRIDLRTQMASPVFQHDRGGTRRAVHDEKVGRWLVTTGANYLLAFSDNPLELLTETKLPSRITEVALSPDDRWLAVASLTDSCYLFSRDDLEKFKVIHGATNAITKLRWTSAALEAITVDGRVLSLSLPDSHADVDEILDPSDPESNLTFATWQLPQFTSSHAPAFEIGRSKRLFLGDNTGNLQVLSTNSKLEIPLRKFSPAIIDLVMLQSLGLLVVTHFNGRVNLVSQQDINCRCNYVGGMQDVTDGSALSRQNSSLTAHRDGALKRWNTTTGEIENETKLHNDEIFCVDVSEKEQRLATMGSDWVIKLSDSESLATLHTMPIGLGVRPVEFSHSGLLLAGPADRDNSAEQREGTFDLWDVQSGAAIRRFAGHNNWVIQFQFSPDDRLVASLALDGTLKTWEVESGQCLTTVDLTNSAAASCFQLLSDSRVAVAHADGSVSLRNLDSGEELVSKRILSNEVSNMVSPKNSNVLIVASSNQPYVTCLDAETLKVLAQFDIGTGNIIGMKTDMNSTRLQILGSNGATRIWSLPASDTASVAPSR